VSFVEGDSYRFAVTGRASDGSVRKITINSFKGGASCGG
jgi:hypothetical protein